MKKLLLATTALLTASSVAVAADINVSLDGMIDFRSVGKSQTKHYKDNDKLSPLNKNIFFDTEALANLKVEAKADNGFNYGANVSMLTAVDQKRHQFARLDKTFVFMEGSFGRIEMGSNYDAATTMRIDATLLGRGPVGYATQYIDFSSMKARAATPSNQKDQKGNVMFYTTSQHFMGEVMNSRANGREMAKKVTYYSPRYAGLQFGASYSPDTSILGDSKGVKLHAPYGDLKNVFDLGLSYSTQLDQFTLGLAATAQLGKTVYNKDATGDLALLNVKRHNVKGYQVGAKLGYANFTLAGSYQTMGKSFMEIPAEATTEVLKKSKLYTLGASYIQGPYGFAVTYLKTNFQGNKFRDISLSADYNFGYLTPYAQVSLVKAEAADKDLEHSRHKGTVYMVGTKLKF